VCDETQLVPTLFASMARRAVAVKLLQGCGRGGFALGSGCVCACGWLEMDRGGPREGYISSYGIFCFDSCFAASIDSIHSCQHNVITIPQPLSQRSKSQ